MKLSQIEQAALNELKESMEKRRHDNQVPRSRALILAIHKSVEIPTWQRFLYDQFPGWAVSKSIKSRIRDAIALLDDAIGLTKAMRAATRCGVSVPEMVESLGILGAGI